MRITLFILLISITSNITFGVSFVPLNMKPGLWEYENPAAKMLEKAFANMSEEVRKIMQSKMKTYKPTQSCLREEDTRSPNYYLQKIGDANCTLDLIRSTNSLFEGNLNCLTSDQKSTINIIMEVVNDKKVISKTKMDSASFLGVNNMDMSSTGLWISSECPATLRTE
ncbi:DUF3617 domain-containing protein [bacterium]|nr:DUF3617 domain-containing protein [bacterium]